VLANCWPRGQQPSKITYQISKSLGFNKDFKISKEDFKIFNQDFFEDVALNLSQFCTCFSRDCT